MAITPAMRPADPQHPSRPMTEREIAQIDDRLQQRFNGDRIDMLNPDPRYALHAMRQTAGAAAAILAPLAAVEGGEAAAGARGVQLAARGARAFGTDTVETIARCGKRIAGALAKTPELTEGDAEALGKSAARFVRGIGSDIARHSLMDMLRGAGAAAAGWLAGRASAARHEAARR